VSGSRLTNLVRARALVADYSSLGAEDRSRVYAALVEEVVRLHSNAAKYAAEAYGCRSARWRTVRSGFRSIYEELQAGLPTTVDSRWRSPIGGGTAGSRRRVYVIQLSHCAAQDEDQTCVYVGQTARSLEERFMQHIVGYKASRHVRDHGIGLRRDLSPRVWFSSRERTDAMEREVVDRLGRYGYRVFGGH
jgi:hypothetical protein